MKKIIAATLVTLMSFNITSTVAFDAYESLNRDLSIKQMLNAKNSMEQNFQWRKYLKIIDSFVFKHWENKQMMEKMKDRVSPLLERESIQNTYVFDIISYMDAKINIALLNIFDEEKNNPYASDITEADKKMIEQEIVDLQLHLFDKASSLIEKLWDEFEKQTNYEETWDFSMDFTMDHESLWKVSSYLKFNDYTAWAHGFDSQLKGQIEWLIDATMQGEESFKIQLSWFMDFISKDGNMYLLLEKLNITDEWTNEQIQEIIEQIKEIAEKNQYIKYSDGQSKQAMKILNSITPNKIISEGKTLFSQAMFEAYKKDGDKYLLKPTKYACDTFKKLGNTFDPFNGSTCSEGQYKNMLEDMAQAGMVFYIIPGEEKQLGFYWEDFQTDYMWFIIYDDSKIIELNLNITPDQEVYPDEWAMLSYKNGQYLNANLSAEEWDIEYNFTSNLDSNNRFTYIDFKWHTASEYSNFAVVLLLKNKIISGEIEMNNSSYDWETRSYKPYQTISGSINGSNDTSNRLSTLKIDMIGKNIDDESEFFNGLLDYSQWNIDLEIHTNDRYSALDFEMDMSYNSVTKEITGWNLYISAKMLDWYSDNETLHEVFMTQMSLINKNISGNTSIQDFWTITHSGRYETWYFQLNNSIEFENNPFMYYYGMEDESDASADFDITIDTRSSKQDAMIHFDFMLDNTKVMNFNMDNDAIRDYKNINIPTPSNTIDFEEIMPYQTGSDSYYYDY